MKYKFITIEEALASYMIEKQKTFISHKELYIFGTYLERTMSNPDCRTIVEYGNEYVKELARKNEGHFVVESQGIACAHNTAYLQKHILSYTSTGNLIPLITAAQSYSKRSASNFLKDQERAEKKKQEQSEAAKNHPQKDRDRG